MQNYFFCYFVIFPLFYILCILLLHSVASCVLMYRKEIANSLTVQFCVYWTAPWRSPSTFPGAFSVSGGIPHTITLYWQVGETASVSLMLQSCSGCSTCCHTQTLLFEIVLHHVNKKTSITLTMPAGSRECFHRKTWIWYRSFLLDRAI